MPLRRAIERALRRAQEGARLLAHVARPLRGAARAIPEGDVAARAQAEGALSAGLGKLFALAENYPDLKASTNFLDLQKQLSESTLSTATKTGLDFMKTLYTANRPVAFYPPGYSAIVPLLTTAYSNVAFSQRTPTAAAGEFFSEANNDLNG